MTFADTVNFLNQNAGVLSTVFSGIVMLATVIYAILTASLVTETRHMREVQTEPKMEVIAIPHEELVSIVTLRVKNIGLGPAYNVSFTLRGESQTTGENELIQDFSKSQFLSKGLRYLGPGQVLQSGFTQMTKNFAEKISAKLIVDVAYKSANEKSYKDSIPIYFEEFEGYATIGTPPLHAMADSLEKIERNIDHLATGFRRLRVDMYSEADRSREREEWDERHSATTKST
ncbi:hypothetical protein GALL_165530 [mine drainage metagenome]|uniref:Uncharacterized protein n=1 Tax=mine drainage metagenome TaxID=410659 RepID=A0A1J5SN22_9ZZZZ